MYVCSCYRSLSLYTLDMEEADADEDIPIELSVRIKCMKLMFYIKFCVLFSEVVIIH